MQLSFSSGSRLIGQAEPVEQRVVSLDNKVEIRYPKAAGHQRLQAPRMSLLGKPINLSAHKSKYRNTSSVRWKMRLRSFLEQPQGLLPWLYHFSL